MATYVNDAIWRRLSEYYNVTPREAQVGDLYKRWLDEKGLNWGSAGDYFISQFPGSTRGDAEWLFWTGGFGDDLVLLLDASMEPQTGTAPQWVLNRADTRVPSARVGSSGRAELRGVYHGLLLPGAVGNSASVPLAASTSVDACVRVQMFASSGVGEMISKWGASGSWGWTLRQNGSNVDAIVSSNGSNLYASVSVAHGMSVGDSAWFRLSYDRLNGRLAVWRADDQDQVPDRWTLLGQSLVAPANIFANATNVTFGVTGANVNPFNGAIKRGVVRSDVDGAVVLDVDFTAATPLASSFVCATGQTVTVTAATGVDSNDPTFLQHTGTNYLYLPGVNGNNASAPDSAALDLTGDYDIRIRVDSQKTAGWNTFIFKDAAYGFYQSAGSRLYALAGNRQFEFSNASIRGTFTGWLRITVDVDDGAGNSVCAAYLNPDSSDMPTVWNLVDTKILATATISPGSSVLRIGHSNFANEELLGKLYRVQIRNGIDGTVVFDADFTSGITSGSQTSFTESSTNAATVTINRSTSGKKSVAVVRPVWLFGTNSYLEVVDSALLDFGATESFTVLALARQWATPTNFGSFVSKRTTFSGSPGYHLGNSATTLNIYSQIQDSSTFAQNFFPTTFAAGSLNVLSLIRDVQADRIYTATNNTVSSGNVDSTTGSLNSTATFRVGADGVAGGSFLDGEILAVAVIRRALTATEIQNIRTWFQNRKW